MPSQVRSVPYVVSNVTSLRDLIEMMRYDLMRFPDTGTGLVWPSGDWRDTVAALSRRDCGIVDKNDPDTHELVVVRDQVRNWHPTERRWNSFTMEIRPAEEWSNCRTIN